MKERVKFFLIFGMGLLLVGNIGMSYALFTTSTEKKGALNIVAGNVYCQLESKDLNDKNQITIESNMQKEIYISLKNTGTVPLHGIITYSGNIDVLNTEDNDGLVEVMSLDKTDFKTFRLVLINNSSIPEAVTFKSKCGLASKELEVDTSEKKIEKLYNPSVDASHMPSPELVDGLIPVKYDEKNKTWIKADISNPLNNLWYDYDNQMWANAVTVEETGIVHNRDYYQKAAVGESISMDDINTMWVWIPRYEYRYDNLGDKYAGGTQEQPGEIEVKILSTTTKLASDNRSYKVHPAFTFGEEELSGIWYAKFETSNREEHYSDDESNSSNLTPIIKPGLPAWVQINIANMFYTSRNMQLKKFNIYGFPNEKSYDTHMSKNSEWGMVAYFSQSRYGKYGNVNYAENNKEIVKNASNPSKTGLPFSNESYDSLDGLATTTTGTIYGVYDMNGAMWDRVMGVLEDGNSGKPLIGSSGFTDDNGDKKIPDGKYYDLYKSDNPASNNIKLSETACAGNICYGHSLSETAGWYGDYHTFATSYASWLRRGAHFSDTTDIGGIYAVTLDLGVAGSFHIVLTPLS